MALQTDPNIKVSPNQFSSTKNTSLNSVTYKAMDKFNREKKTCLYRRQFFDRMCLNVWIFIQLSLLMKFSIVCYRLSVVWTFIGFFFFEILKWKNSSPPIFFVVNLVFVRLRYTRVLNPCNFRHSWRFGVSDAHSDRWVYGVHSSYMDTFQR